MGSFFTLHTLFKNNHVPNFALFHSSFSNFKILAKHLSREIPNDIKKIYDIKPPLAEPYGKILLILNSPKIIALFEKPLKARQVLLNYLMTTKDTYNWKEFFLAISSLPKHDQHIILNKLDPSLLPFNNFKRLKPKNKIITNVYLSHSYHDKLIPISHGNELASLLKGKAENLYYHITGMEHAGGKPPGTLAKIIAVIKSSFFIIDFGNN